MMYQLPGRCLSVAARAYAGYEARHGAKSKAAGVMKGKQVDIFFRGSRAQRATPAPPRPGLRLPVARARVTQVFRKEGWPRL